MHRVSFVENFGTRYTKGSVVFCTFDHEVPVFGKITDIVLLEPDDCIFVLVPYVGSNFCAHYNAYEVHNTDELFIYRQKDLIDHHLLTINRSFSHLLNQKSFVTLKYNVFV